MAIAALDSALWDLKARLLDVPLLQLLGAARNAIPVYGAAASRGTRPRGSPSSSRAGCARMLPHTGEHDTVDAWAISGERAFTVIVTNFALPRHPMNDESVEIVLRRCAAAGSASLRRIDSRLANAKAAWHRLREPEYPSAAQLTRPAQASLSRAERIAVERARGETTLRVRVPPRGVAAIDRARRDVR